MTNIFSQSLAEFFAEFRGNSYSILSPLRKVILLSHYCNHHTISHIIRPHPPVPLPQKGKGEDVLIYLSPVNQHFMLRRASSPPFLGRGWGWGIMTEAMTISRVSIFWTFRSGLNLSSAKLCVVLCETLREHFFVICIDVPSFFREDTSRCKFFLTF
jgi:hypothetical protein